VKAAEMMFMRPAAEEMNVWNLT